ncbi:MAG: ABC transporter ATP-binding protein [Desulfobacterales bacterium]|nr:ABC transporter ATP-binding protein [Desulfobacterales bacterium]
MADSLLNVKELSVEYRLGQRRLKALSRVNFELAPGEILGVAGESGCGKSTLGKAIMGLLPEVGKITAGEMVFKGRDLARISEREMDEKIRGAEMTMIFQNPQSALNPVFRISTQMMDIMAAQDAHKGNPTRNKAARLEKAVAQLKETGIADPESRINNYPFEFSGGMKQRVAVSLALNSGTSLLIADEPTTALDVTIEAQINQLIVDMAEKYNTSVLYISHDLGVLSETCDRIMIMYAGKIFESGTVEQVFGRPGHPYTAALLAAMPGNREPGHPLLSLPGHVPPLDELPRGCPFHPRCKFGDGACSKAVPPLTRLGRGHQAACWKNLPNARNGERPVWQWNC